MGPVQPETITFAAGVWVCTISLLTLGRSGVYVTAMGVTVSVLSVYTMSLIYG